MQVILAVQRGARNPNGQCVGWSMKDKAKPMRRLVQYQQRFAELIGNN